MHAALVLHDRVDLVTVDLELDGLETAGLRRARIEHLELPALCLAEALVHLKKIAGKDGGLVAAGSGADLNDGVLLIVGVARDKHELDVFLKLGKLGLVVGDVLLEHGLLIRIGGVVQHLLGGLDVIERREVLARRRHQCGLVRILLVEAGELLDIGCHRRVGELLFELLVGGDEFL